MQYLVTQITLCLGIAAIIGAVIGWWLKGIGSAQQMKSIENEWESRNTQLEDDQKVLSRKLEEQEKNWQTKVGSLEKERDSVEARLEETEKSLTSRIDDLDQERSVLSTKFKEEKNNWFNISASLESERDEVKSRLTDFESSLKTEQEKRLAIEKKHDVLGGEIIAVKEERDKAFQTVEKEKAGFKNSLTALQLERDGLLGKMKDLDSSAKAQISDLEKKCDDIWTKHERFKENALRSETKVKKFIANFPDTKDNYPIEDIEGISKGNCDKLRAMGITGTGSLLARCGDTDSRREISEKLHVEGAMVRRWVSQADLMRVRGVGGQYAELLEKAGIQSVEDLQRVNAIAMAEKMKEINDEDQLFPGYYLPDANAVSQWIEQAQKLKG